MRAPGTANIGFADSPLAGVWCSAFPSTCLVHLSCLPPPCSGYPADPETKKWLEASIDRVYGFPSLVRFRRVPGCGLFDGWLAGRMYLGSC